MVTKTILATLHLYIYCTMDCLHGCTITPINWECIKFNLYVIYDPTHLMFIYIYLQIYPNKHASVYDHIIHISGSGGTHLCIQL